MDVPTERALRLTTSILLVVAWGLATAALVKRLVCGGSLLTGENGMWLAFTGIACGWFLSRRAPKVSVALLLVGSLALLALSVRSLLGPV